MSSATAHIPPAAIGALCLLSACAPPTPERAADRCEQRARLAQGPSGSVTVGVNSSEGPFLNGRVAISADYLDGRDPLLVYRTCVIDLTGAEPIRPPRLRIRR